MIVAILGQKNGEIIRRKKMRKLRINHWTYPLLISGVLWALLPGAVVNTFAQDSDSKTSTVMPHPQGHSDGLLSFAFSPCGQLLASASTDHTIKLWNLASGKLIYSLNGHNDGVGSVAFSIDGKSLASSSWNVSRNTDKIIKLWDVSTGKNIATLKGHTAMVNSLVFSPDGKTLASGSEDETIRIWDVATGRDNATLKSPGSFPADVVFNKDGKMLASVNVDSETNAIIMIKLWDLNTQREIATLDKESERPDSDWPCVVNFSPDGKTLVSGHFDGTIWLWNVASGKNIYILEGHDFSPIFAFSPNGKTLASGTGDGEIKLWNFDLRKNTATFKENSCSIMSLVYSQDGKSLMSATEDDMIRRTNAETGKVENLLCVMGGPELKPPGAHLSRADVLRIVKEYIHRVGVSPNLEMPDYRKISFRDGAWHVILFGEMPESFTIVEVDDRTGTIKLKH
jgi:WD40 repeat protein